jgi:putative hydrolase of the HAD superfamily
MYKAVIFDFFDVIHRDPFHHWLSQNGLERKGSPQESSKLLDLGRISDEEFYGQLGALSGQTADDVRAVFDDITFIDKDMVLLIARLKKSYKTGLLSNSSIEYLSRIIARHELESLFDAMTISAEVGIIKPDPRIFEHILDRLGVGAAEAVLIDDNPRNVEAASRLGIKGIVYDGDVGKLKENLSGILGIRRSAW